MDCELTLQITDLYNNYHGFRKQDLNFRDFSGDGLMMSDIQLYQSINDEELKEIIPVFVINDITVSPYPQKEIRISDPILCYFEIYNLFSLHPDQSYDLEIKLKPTRKPFKLFGITLRKPKDQTISIIQKRRIENNVIKDLISLDLNSLDEGTYTLEISIVSPQTNEILVSSKKNIVLKN